MYKLFKEIIKILKLSFYFLYFISKVFPKNKNLWVFGADNKNSFQGNSKYLFLYLSDLKPNNMKIYWITNNKNLLAELKKKGLNALFFRSFRGVWTVLRAGIWIYNHYTSDISYWFSAGAKKINLWHGTPIKKIAWDYKKGNSVRYPKKWYGKILNRLFYPAIFQKPDIILATSKFSAKNLSTAFKLKSDQIIISGNPRNDVFFIKINGFEINCDPIYNKIERLKEKNKIVFYMPTYRDNSEDKFYNHLNFKKLNVFLEKYDLIFIIKAHPWDHIKDMKNFIKGERIYFVEKNTDPYPILGLTDILITDYSSVFIDFLLLDRYIIFFPYDLDRYIKSERELYYNYDDITPGIKVFEYDGLEKYLKAYLEGQDMYELQRKKALSYFFDEVGVSSPMIYKKIIETMGK